MDLGGGLLILPPLLFSRFFPMQPRMRMEPLHLERALRWALRGVMRGAIVIGMGDM